MRKPGTIVTAVAAALVLGACSPPGEQESDEPPGTDLTPVEPADADDTDDADDEDHCTAEDFTVDGDPGERPEITVPEDCAAPEELLVEDLEEGTGAEAQEGDTVEVHYELVTFSDGEWVDGSWERDETFSVDNVGQSEMVIDGWNEGLLGIAEDTRRLLVVPPELGYGEQGSPPAIGPDETLVFVIDGVSVTGG
ncbi:FKBP-type peptidyl-prolyl cis-trans isomerase [Haloechinothrix sp. LS1_15]|uniref:FKBP-type peptidyl-prolyl cis-trans isomerase n=1 Tax=Haloechinothrix sp. LS1_15 TaxID=2652248 RepID=UPI00294599E8|nr:FKBP-type peptidyl-prolyl cis-trans isomerase [Haloechinothrix sp. LS1_15]MDV6013229.1 FKBP-type peptidyl-prolyl cis-trans isomerase [Haloechinothrix sp. LS1_15]